MCCLLTWISDPQKEKKESKTIMSLSETVEAFVGKFGCALGGSLQNIWFEGERKLVTSKWCMNTRYKMYINTILIE
jgi:hypothetical protein